TDLSVGAPAGTQPPPLHQGSERNNARRGHSSDQVRSHILFVRINLKSGIQKFASSRIHPCKEGKDEF
ncbi:hypothetical protein A2U01_0048033, partial [Trifolium medium]|nr:hypothetical protein [Trifolium medium]